MLGCRRECCRREMGAQKERDGERGQDVERKINTSAHARTNAPTQYCVLTHVGAALGCSCTSQSSSLFPFGTPPRAT